MEILFFLVILGIQFAYQIYQAVNKNKQERLEKSGTPSPDPSPDPIEGWGVPEERSTLSSDPVDQAYQVKKKPSHDFYNQFFGFIEEPSEVSPENNFTRVKDTTGDPATQYVRNTPKEEFFNSEEGEGAYSYDDYYEEDKTTLSPMEDISFYQEQKSPVFPGIPTPLKKSSILINIRQQLKHPQSFKNAWRIKFILDPPPALSRNRDFF